MKAASPQTVDRLIGALVAVCASALIAALGARIGPSFTTLFRLAYHAHHDCPSADESSGNGSNKRRSRGRRKASGGEGEGDHDHDDSQGDAYFSFAYGSRSSVRLRAVAGSTRETPAARGEEGGEGVILVVHVGSCHCGGLAFEVQAPEHLVALEAPSKVRFPYITVSADRFRLTSDDRNGSLYLLKCRPPSGRDTTPKISAHFFCRRCGVHVVHAPDFPHAVVANVNVHCLRPASIRSLAVAFLRGGGAEVPGMGDPVEGMYEVGRESWPDAVRERVSVALQQPLGGHAATAPSISARGVRKELPLHHRSASLTSPPSQSGALDGTSWEFDGRGVHGQGQGVGVGNRSWRDARAPIAAVETAAGVTRAPDMSTLRRTAEQCNQAPLHHDVFSSDHRSSPSSGSSGAAAANGSTTWGEVLMHVASLHSNVQPRKSWPPPPNGVASASSNSSTSSNAGSVGAGGYGQPVNGGWGLRSSENFQRAEREQRVAFGGSGFGGSGFGGGGEFLTRGEGFPVRGSGTKGAGAEGGERGTNGHAIEGMEENSEETAALRPRRSRSVDSSVTSNTAVGSPARGVSLRDEGEENSGGSRSPAGSGWKDGRSWGSAAGGGSRAVAATGEASRPMQQHQAPSREREGFVRSPPAEGVPGGFAATQA